MPKFLQDLISSPEYVDAHSDVYARVTEYMKLLYPGTVDFDATGRMVQQEHDMTLVQFKSAQEKIDSDFEDAKQEAETEIQEEYGEYFANVGFDFNIDDYVVQDDNVEVKVLFPDGDIRTMDLLLYDLDIPEFKQQSKIWRWHSEDEENTCDECAGRDGEVFWSEDEIPKIPVHPNCRCSISEDVIDEDGKTISSKPYKHTDNKTQGQNMNDEKFEQAYNKLKEPEGGYTNGKNQVRDEPTNMGIKQSTMDKYAAKHPESNMPRDVKDLTPSQAREIYKNEYWDNTKIPQIKNDRIRNAVFDMNVMSGLKQATITIQRAFNSYTGGNIAVDGKLGKETIGALNNIPENKINDFMNIMIDTRLQSLQKMTNWPTAKNGWKNRTEKY